MNPPPEASFQSRRLFKRLDWSRAQCRWLQRVPIMITHGEVHFHHTDDIWLLKAHIIISQTVSGGSSAAVAFFFLLSGACYGLDTNQVVAAP